MKEKTSTAVGPTKKEIQHKIQDSVNLVIGELKISQPSKKVKRTVKKASKLLARKVKHDLKESKMKSSKVTDKMNGKIKKSQPAV